MRTTAHCSPQRRSPHVGLVIVLLLGFLATATEAAAGKGIFVSNEEIAKLPTSGSAWNGVLNYANGSTSSPDISNQEDPVNVRVLAKALVYARTGQQSYRTEVVNAVMKCIGTESGGRTLALGRELVAYVIAADLVDLSASDEAEFKSYLRSVRHKTLDGKTLISTHEVRPNNWGTHAGASRIAVAMYLGEDDEVARIAQVMKGWLGDRSAYSGFKYGDLTWQADKSKPVGVNPPGARSSEGHNLDGVLPDDQRRTPGSIDWPPPKENYVWEALQGTLPTAIMLHRAGYDVWNWENRALLRAVEWLHEQANYPAQGDDQWQPHIVNHFYGTNFPTRTPANPGKNVGFTDWIYGSGATTPDLGKAPAAPTLLPQGSTSPAGQ